MAWQEDLQHGASASKFGDQDYFAALKQVWDAGHAGPDRQEALRQKREDILSWMGKAENLDKIHESNRLGVEGGLGQRIASGELTHAFQGSAGAGSKDWFGHADLYAGRAAGHSWDDILSHLDANEGKLRNQNVKGGGGLYDEVKTQSRFDTERGDWRDAFESSFESVTDQLTASQEAFNTGFTSVSDAIKAQTASTEKYQAQQDVWRRRQENMQQLQMQESRRARKDKPVIAVMPGSSSYGGGGGGAGAFARKKKQTTGLNIA